MAQQSNVRFLTIFLFVSILQFSFANGFCHTSIAPSVHRSPLLKVYNTENVFDTKKFCYKTIDGLYEISLFEDQYRTVTFKLYDNRGNLIKTLQGTWDIREDVFIRLTLTWTGPNSDKQPLGFICIYNLSRYFEAIIDGQDRKWNRCN
jgi:hypothetical protein